MKSEIEKISVCIYNVQYIITILVSDLSIGYYLFKNIKYCLQFYRLSSVVVYLFKKKHRLDKHIRI